MAELLALRQYVPGVAALRVLLEEAGVHHVGAVEAHLVQVGDVHVLEEDDLSRLLVLQVELLQRLRQDTGLDYYPDLAPDYLAEPVGDAVGQSLLVNDYKVVAAIVHGPGEEHLLGHRAGRHLAPVVVVGHVVEAVEAGQRVLCEGQVGHLR